MLHSRFGLEPEGVAFEYDDPFLGGVTRAGLDAEKAAAALL